MRLTIYSKPGCHLCEEMKATVALVLKDRPALVVEEIDISLDPSLMASYEAEIPVLMIDGKKAAKYRISEQELRQRLDGRG
jgi:glutaredoxin